MLLVIHEALRSHVPPAAFAPLTAPRSSSPLVIPCLHLPFLIPFCPFLYATHLNTLHFRLSVFLFQVKRSDFYLCLISPLSSILNFVLPIFQCHALHYSSLFLYFVFHSLSSTLHFSPPTLLKIMTQKLSKTEAR